MKAQEIIDNYNQYILSTYNKTPLIFVKGKGMNLMDIHGKTYLDFFPGWGVSNVGHCHPKVMAGVRDQNSKLIHLPNNFYHPFQAKLAREIIRTSFPGKVFFSNSGAEACEAAIKFSRLYGEGKRFEIITFMNSFHGRTLGALAATGQKKYQEGFSPLPEGFKTIPFNDLQAFKDTMTEKTIAVLLELVQGEGGINVVSEKYLKELRWMCTQKNILLIFDEVQTGMGRTGEMYAFKHFGIEPDLMILAKALGGGLPIGALVVKESLAGTFRPGTHASTFGGSPLVCKASLGVFKAIASGKMLPHARKMGAYIREKLLELKSKTPCIKDVRGLGLMIGIELSIPGKPVYEECLKRGLIVNCTQESVIRFMPALTVTKKQADKAIFILAQSLKQMSDQANGNGVDKA